MKKAPAESDGALVRLDFSQVTKPVSLDLQRRMEIIGIRGGVQGVFEKNAHAFLELVLFLKS